MPPGRLTRFLRLERPRAEGAPEPADAAGPTAGRFEAVRRPPGAGPAGPTATGAALERFGPEPEPSIELVEADAAARPFTRCVRCGMDHNVFATRCTGCNADLDTAEQRAFNERLWAERQAEAAREGLDAAERRARADAEDAGLRRERRAAAEELAREVGEEERRRLGGDPLLAAAARLLPPRWRVPAAIAAGALAAGLLVAAPWVRGARTALGAVALVALVLLAPRRPSSGW